MRRYLVILCTLVLALSCTQIKFEEVDVQKVRFTCSVEEAPYEGFNVNIIASRRGKPYHQVFLDKKSDATDTMEVEQGHYSIVYYLAEAPAEGASGWGTWYVTNLESYPDNQLLTMEDVEAAVNPVTYPEGDDFRKVSASGLVCMPGFTPRLYRESQVYQFPYATDTSTVYDVSFGVQQVMRHVDIRVKIAPKPGKPVTKVIANITGVPSRVELYTGLLDARPGIMGQVATQLFQEDPEIPLDQEQVYVGSMQITGIVPGESPLMYVALVQQGSKIIRTISLDRVLVGENQLLEETERPYYYRSLEDKPRLLDFTPWVFDLSVADEETSGSGEDPMNDWRPVDEGIDIEI